MVGGGAKMGSAHCDIQAIPISLQVFSQAKRKTFKNPPNVPPSVLYSTYCILDLLQPIQLYHIFHTHGAAGTSRCIVRMSVCVCVRWLGGGEWLLTPLPTPHLHTYALQTPAATVNHWPWWRKQQLYTQHWSKPPKQ